MRSSIEFPGHGGTTLRGWLYVPEGARNGPALVMAHGFSATIDMGIDAFARVFCKAGITVLAYDQRNLGISDGEPRQEINIWAQTRDYCRTLDWLERRPEVDPGRIGVWGSSFSGGEALVVGACDPRVAAVIANVPFASLPEGTENTHGSDAFEAIRSALFDDSGNGPADSGGAPIGPLAVIAEDGVDLPVFLPFEEATAWFLENRSATWQNRVTLQALPSMPPPFDPAACVAHIAPRALLMVLASQDRMASVAGARATFARAGEPKHLEVIEGDHFVTYQGAGFTRASTVMRDFLLAHL